MQKSRQEVDQLAQRFNKPKKQPFTPPEEPGLIDETPELVMTAYGVTTGINAILKARKIERAAAIFRAQIAKDNFASEILYVPKQLKKKYKHALYLDFPNYKEGNEQLLQKWLQDFTYSPNTLMKKGTYRSTMPGTHFYDPDSRIWVFINEDNNFHVLYKLGFNQLRRLITKGDVR